MRVTRDLSFEAATVRREKVFPARPPIQQPIVRRPAARCSWLACIVALVAGIGCAPRVASGVDSAADWPQWLGPHRDGVSPLSDMLTAWPEGGPPRVWSRSLGSGFSGVSVAAGRAYTMAVRGDRAFALCFDAATGDELWSVETGSRYVESQGGDGPRSTPAVDGELVFFLTASGDLLALRTSDGSESWRRSFADDFGGRRPYWGYSSSPLVDGDRVVVEPGGSKGRALVALHKKTGAVVWESASDLPGYSSPLVIDAAGVGQLLFFTAAGLTSVAPRDGNSYWQYPWETAHKVNAATPLFLPPDRVFISSGYGKGASMLRIEKGEKGLGVQTLWTRDNMKNHFATSIHRDNHIYGFDNGILKCIAAATGDESWRQRGFGKGTLIYADGHLIVLGEKGRLALVTADPERFTEVAGFQAVDGRCWTVPSLAGGYLYLRTETEIVCLDLKGQK